MDKTMPYALSLIFFTLSVVESIDPGHTKGRLGTVDDEQFRFIEPRTERFKIRGRRKG